MQSPRNIIAFYAIEARRPPRTGFQEVSVIKLEEVCRRRFAGSKSGFLQILHKKHGLVKTDVPAQVSQAELLQLCLVGGNRFQPS